MGKTKSSLHSFFIHFIDWNIIEKSIGKENDI